MQLADPQMVPVAYLILRQLYDGDVIDWPIPDDHALHALFSELEAQGYVARWDRMWPRHDRYRLTDLGIATIEAVYRPATSEALWFELRALALAPAARRAWLVRRGLDPRLWPVVHDPTTHWDSWADDHGLYYGWLWEDEQPYRRRRPLVTTTAAATDDDDPDGVELEDDDDDDELASPAVRAVAHVVDLDREAGLDGDAPEPASADYEVS